MSKKQKHFFFQPEIRFTTKKMLYIISMPLFFNTLVFNLIKTYFNIFSMPVLCPIASKSLVF
jgi:hypothetical protein